MLVGTGDEEAGDARAGEFGTKGGEAFGVGDDFLKEAIPDCHSSVEFHALDAWRRRRLHTGNEPAASLSRRCEAQA
jgi:hypothetical protein